MFASDTGSDRATSIEDYQNTCAEFITDISKDYRDGVDRYQLPEAENKSRKTTIDNIVKTTNDWIFRYADTIKKVDIIMNDGVSKMAENTAGYPFKFERITCCIFGHFTNSVIHDNVYLLDSISISENPIICCLYNIVYSCFP